MKISKAMCVLFSGLALLTLAIVVQMNRFTMSGFDDKSGTDAASTKPAPSKPEEPMSLGAQIGFGFLGICIGCFAAYMVTRNR
jgi:hypothetical protein